MELFSDADLAVKRGSDVDYRASIDDPRVDEVRILRPQEIPRYVADGMFDIGITGRDWVEETGAEVCLDRRAPVFEELAGRRFEWCSSSRRTRPCSGSRISRMAAGFRPNIPR